jgi:hypothetical protein
MKLSLTLFASLILATTSLAAPRTSRNSRNSRRQLPQNLASIANSTTATNATNNHQNSRTLQSLPKKISTKQSKNKATTSHTTIDYSSNWGGAVIQTPPTGQTFNAVSGAIQVPTPSIPPNGMGTGESFAAAVWVGIDGDTYTEAILQTGIDMNVAADGSVSFDAWYEWFPDYSYTFDIEINAGDEISMTVIASSGNEGTAIIENITTGDQAYINLSSNYTLGGQNAEWIVEDFEVNNELVAFADFGTVTFTNCVATTAEQTLGVETASIIEIGDSGGQLTGVDIVNTNEVVVFWKSH